MCIRDRVNDLSSVNGHNIDFHAVNGPGGGAEVTNVAPGETATFTWKALHAGAFVYHLSLIHICWFGRDDDPLEIGPNLRPILVALAENNQLRRAELRFKGRTRHGEEVEAEIIIEGGERPR